MKITEIDMRDPNYILITGLIEGGKCPVCDKVTLTPQEMLEHFDTSECKDKLKDMIKQSMEEMENGGSE